MNNKKEKINKNKLGYYKSKRKSKRKESVQDRIDENSEILGDEEKKRKINRREENI